MFAITSYIKTKLIAPCRFINDGFEEYLREYLNNYLELNQFGLGNIANGRSYLDSLDDVTDLTLEFKCVTEFEEAPDENEEEDDFIRKYRDEFKKFVDGAIDHINEFLKDDDLFGYLPDADIMTDGDSIFVKLAYHQKALDLELKPASIEFTGDIDDILSDMYFSF